MPYRISVFSSHPLVVKFLIHLFSSNPEFKGLLLPPKTDFPALPRHSEKCIFVLDALFLPMGLSKLARTLRVHCPRSWLLALVGPRESDQEILRLLYNGIEGIVRMGDNLEKELLRAIRALFSGALWAPKNVLDEYVHQTNLLFNPEFLSRIPLTGRESQVLQMMIRRFCNREIAGALRISERTVRFHVSNIFTKLHVADRRSLLTVIEKLMHKPA